MGRRRVRPERGPEYGIARGALQRAVLSLLLAGDVLNVVAVGGGKQRRPPAGLTRRSWDRFQDRILARGYALEWGTDDYAAGMFDTYRLTRLLPEPGPAIVI